MWRKRKFQLFFCSKYLVRAVKLLRIVVLVYITLFIYLCVLFGKLYNLEYHLSIIQTTGLKTNFSVMLIRCSQNISLLLSSSQATNLKVLTDRSDRTKSLHLISIKPNLTRDHDKGASIPYSLWDDDSDQQILNLCLIDKSLLKFRLV